MGRYGTAGQARREGGLRDKRQKSTSVARSSRGTRLEPAWSYGAVVSVLRVQRAKTAVGLLRRIVVEVDGRAVLRVGWGQTVEVAIEPGQHSVRARADWQTSPMLQVNISADETVTVRVTHPFSSIRKLLRNTDSAIRIERL